MEHVKGVQVTETIDYATRQRALLDRIDVDAFLILSLEGTDEDCANMMYLSGYWGLGALLVSDDGVIPLASPTNIGMARAAAPHLAWTQLDWDYIGSIAKTIQAAGFRSIGVAAKRISLASSREIESRVDAKIVFADDPILQLREIKDTVEIERIRRATQITEKSLEALLAEIRIGDTERSLSLRLEWLMRERGAESVAFDLIVAAGSHSALPHHRPGDRAIQEGDALLFDIGARVGGYCSDITRTVSVGRPSAKLLHVYKRVLEANEAGIEALVQGASGAEVEAASRRGIEAAGFGENLPHGVSHGLGLEIHEPPASAGPRAVDRYERRMVVTMEPAIYLEETAGVRIEDVVLVGETPHVLSSFPKSELIEVG